MTFGEDQIVDALRNSRPDREVALKLTDADFSLVAALVEAAMYANALGTPGQRILALLHGKLVGQWAEQADPGAGRG